MRWPKQILRAFRDRFAKLPTTGKLLTIRKQDSEREYVSAGLTPRKLIAILAQADDGDLSSAMSLFEQMEEKDAHLYSVANTRRLALTGREWTVTPANTPDDEAPTQQATEAVEYCREVLGSIDNFDKALKHLSLALGRNISVAELVWDWVDGSLHIVSIDPVDSTRLVFDDVDVLRVKTDSEPDQGITLALHKFVVHTPHAISGHPQRGGLLRVTAMSYLAKMLSLKDWMIFSEIFGMPVRIAKYAPNATPEEKEELIKMLESLGTNAAGIFSQAVQLDIIETGRGTMGPPYPALVAFLNREISKAWLGQTLTTDVSNAAGTKAASTVHEQVRQDIAEDDRRSEADTVRGQILTPLARFKFGPDVQVPIFQRAQGKPKDAETFARVVGQAVNQLGIEVPADWARRQLGIPQPTAGQEVLKGTPTGKTTKASAPPTGLELADLTAIIRQLSDVFME